MRKHIAYVDEMVAVAATTLKASLQAYWPTYGDTGAPERNLSLHFGSAFLNAGFAVSGEGHAEGSAKPRYDLVAYSGERKLFVAGEFKQLYKAGSARGMREDIRRLLSFKPVRRPGSVAKGMRCVGLIAAFSEVDNRYRQLTTLGNQGKCASTRELAETLPAPARWRSVPLLDHGRHPDRRGELRLPYAILPLEPAGR